MIIILPVSLTLMFLSQSTMQQFETHNIKELLASTAAWLQKVSVFHIEQIDQYTADGWCLLKSSRAPLKIIVISNCCRWNIEYYFCLLIFKLKFHSVRYWAKERGSSSIFSSTVDKAWAKAKLPNNSMSISSILFHSYLVSIKSSQPVFLGKCLISPELYIQVCLNNLNKTRTSLHRFSLELQQSPERIPSASIQ